MAVLVFEIKWDGPFTLDVARRHRIARGSGVYICWEGRKAKYIGKSKALCGRLSTHKQELARYDKDGSVKSFV